ncbi:ABC transporter ATP-binding protein, partial [Shouchella clausii]|uniref:ABC transporter ATP-binding protein n=2 Tax=Bacillaceae TaxID=186817 RepID=UPI000BA72AB6
MVNFIRMKNITKSSNKKTILKDVNITLGKGEILGFVGPNGSGKSTTLKILSGLYKPTSGKIFINNSELDDELKGETAQSIGVFIEEPRFINNLTGRRNLIHHCRIYGIDTHSIDEYLMEFGLYESADIKVKNYSLGMKQKLGIIRVFLHKPQIVLLDEPTNGLDPEATVHLRGYLQSYVKSGNSIIISSHLLAELEKLCDRIVYIHKGEVKDSSEFNNSKTQYKLITDKNISELSNIPMESKKERANGLDLYETKIRIKFEELPFLVSLLESKKVKIYLIEKDTNY